MSKKIRIGIGIGIVAGAGMLVGVHKYRKAKREEAKLNAETPREALEVEAEIQEIEEKEQKIARKKKVAIAGIVVISTAVIGIIIGAITMAKKRAMNNEIDMLNEELERDDGDFDFNHYDREIDKESFEGGDTFNPYADIPTTDIDEDDIGFTKIE